MLTADFVQQIFILIHAEKEIRVKKGYQKQMVYSDAIAEKHAWLIFYAKKRILNS